MIKDWRKRETMETIQQNKLLNALQLEINLETSYIRKKRFRLSKRKPPKLRYKPWKPPLTMEEIERRKERQRFFHANTRAKRRGAIGYYTIDDIREIRIRQNDMCNKCKIPLNGKGEKDHIIPLSRKGTNWPSNIQLLCSPCNRTKSNKYQYHARKSF